jgi:5-methylcytosine-specific restriction endonuclease McrA
MQDEGYKRCGRCGETKPLAEFYFRKDRGKHRGTCKSCMADDRTPEWRARNRDNARRWRQENADRRRAYLEANRERQREYERRWREENRERLREQARERYAANAQAMVAKTRAWQNAHPEYMREVWRANTYKRRALKRGRFVERIESLVVLERDDGVCWLCGTDVDPTDFTVDHVIPLSKGGEESYANARLAHRSCNSRKGAQAP